MRLPIQTTTYNAASSTTQSAMGISCKAFSQPLLVMAFPAQLCRIPAMACLTCVAYSIGSAANTRDSTLEFSHKSFWAKSEGCSCFTLNCCNNNRFYVPSSHDNERLSIYLLYVAFHNFFLLRSSKLGSEISAQFITSCDAAKCQ